MAQVDIGKIKIVWKNAWDSATAYTVDDAVSHSGNSYICIQAGTNQNPSTATAYWSIMASAGSNGTNGTDADLLNIASTAQGDIYYNNGSAIARLAPGSASQVLQSGGAGANPSWINMSSDVVKVASINYTANNSNTVSIDGMFSADYKYYEIIIYECQSPQWLKSRVNVGGSADSSSSYSNNNYYLRAGSSGTSDGKWGTNNANAWFGPTYWSNSTNPYGAFTIQVFDPLNTSRGKYVFATQQIERSGGNYYISMGGGVWQDDRAISGITIFNETTGNNMNTLKGAVYGYKF
ncbi:putative carbohydrate binding domain containing protein [uncultured Mediterranean phage uvMED]|nr:putative carbohydrate binding domain containing protein [uncultured Mediterranean phage uvMED]